MLRSTTAASASRWTTGTSARSLKYFVHLYERGLLYRDNRIVNWCPRCASAISDLEVEHSEVDDRLFTIRYPLADGSGHLTIATVRPPTMLADVAVAVHPDDERYRDADRQGGDRARRRAPRSYHRRRPRRPRVRHWRGQDHARPRSDGLRDRAHARAPRADRHRPRRAHERGGGRARRSHAGARRRSESSRSSATAISWSPRSHIATRSGTAPVAVRGSSR